jgi:MFS family permease
VNTEHAIKTAIGFFFIILVGSILSAFVGGAFGALVATISPEFVTGLFSPKDEQGIVRYAFAVGMIWGIFIGAAVSGFACFLAAVLKILRIRFETQKEKEANKGLNGTR